MSLNAHEAFAGEMLDPIGTPFFLLTTLTGNAQGSASAMIQAPGAPNLVGQVFYLQAATQDWSGLVRLSGGRQTTIQ